MRRFLRLGIAAMAVAAVLAACGGEEEEAGTATPAATAARTATPAATKTAAATARPATPTPKPVTQTPPRGTPTVAAPTPQARQPVWTVSQVSGAAAVDIVLEDGLGHNYTMASIDPEVSQFEKWDVEFVADLNGDGIVEAVVLHYTGGAHCCFEYWLFSEAPSGIRLDDAFLLGNDTVEDVEDLDGDSVLELQAWDDRLAYFPGLSYAVSPSLPLVLCRTTEGKYTDCTVQFPARMQEAADNFEARLSDAVQSQGTDEEKRSAALGLVAAHLLLAPTDEGWTKVRSICPECETWLMQNSEELEKRLSLVQPQPVGQ